MSRHCSTPLEGLQALSAQPWGASPALVHYGTVMLSASDRRRRRAAFMAGTRQARRCAALALVSVLSPCGHVAAESPPGFDPRAVDAEQDPCHDFYAYACGPWLRSHPIPADRSAWDPYYQLAQQGLEHVRGILDGSIRVAGVDGTKTRDDYASCMDEAAIERAGVAPLADELKRIDAIRTADDSVAVLARLHTLGSRGLFSLRVRQDFADADRVIATVDLPSLSMPDRAYYLGAKPEQQALREKFRLHVSRMLEHTGLAHAAAVAGADAVLRFETSLAKAQPPREQMRDPMSQHHPMTRERLAALAPGFSWKVYFSGLGVAEPADLNVASPEYWRSAAAAWLALPAPEQRAFLRWLLVDQLESVLPARFVQQNFHFYGQDLRGTKEMQPRWKRCVHTTNRHLGEAVGRQFVASSFAQDHKARVLAMIRAIQAELRSVIESAQWMTERTRAEALAKIDAYRIKVGYPDQWRDYSGLKIARGDAFGNAVRASRFDFARRLAKLGKAVNRDEWFSLPQEVDGYEGMTLVEVVFTAGFLQPPFFDPRLDDAVNYGALGRAIGHELTHGFDDDGRQFDRHGTLRNWWAPADAKAFGSRAQCFVDQYSQYVVVDGNKLNGKLTLGENIADNGGMRLAYAALAKKLAGKPRTLVDGMGAEQRLFLAFAQTQCVNVTDATLRSRLLGDSHSPGRYRVNGTLSNMPEFAKAFSCKAADAMVRSHPCRVW